MTPEQSREVNRRVLKEYRRTFHYYKPELTEWDALYILDWTLDTREGREAYTEAVKAVCSPPEAAK